MKLHPMTYGIFGLAIFGLFTLATVVIPLLIVGVVAMVLLRSTKFPSFHDLDNFVEASNVHRVRALDVCCDNRGDVQDASKHITEVSRI